MKSKKKSDEKELRDDLEELLQNETQEDKTIENEETTDEDSPKEDKDENWQQKCEELSDKNLRLMAEFDNYRKRTLSEKAELIKNGGERVFLDILPLIDDFERALAAMETAEDVEAVKEGVHLIYDKFISFLNKNGVKEIPTENEVFDVDLHEAITTFPAPSEELKGKIIDCTAKGYTLNEKVIRFSKVVVGE